MTNVMNGGRNMFKDIKKDTIAVKAYVILVSLVLILDTFNTLMW